MTDALQTRHLLRTFASPWIAPKTVTAEEWCAAFDKLVELGGKPASVEGHLTQSAPNFPCKS